MRVVKIIFNSLTQYNLYVFVEPDRLQVPNFQYSGEYDV